MRKALIATFMPRVTFPPFNVHGSEVFLIQFFQIGVLSLLLQV